MAELVLALDSDAEPARRLAGRLPGLRWAKIGPVLFTAAGPAFVEELRGRGCRIFLDLKWHDIPNTVRGAVARARALGADMVTVHALGGRSMMEAAKEAAGDGLAVVAVTVLTSHDLDSFATVTGRRPETMATEVLRLADLARSAGVDGVVGSVQEARALRERLGPKALIVTPGIRNVGDPVGDQTRVATASEAVRAGATHLVVGRAVTAAADPARAWAGLVEAVGQ